MSPVSVSWNHTRCGGEGPIRYTAANSSHVTLLRLLWFIFQGRTPEPYEILWCDKTSTLCSARDQTTFVE